MKISVVTVSFNQARYLERCLESVLAQAGVEVEYIVVDGGSSDGSVEILERHRARLSHLIVEPDDGAADGLNKGFAKATGGILYYLNSDDVVWPGTFKSALAVFDADPAADVVYGDGVMIDADDRILRASRSNPRFSVYRCAIGAAAVTQQATFFRAGAFRAVGGFNVQNRTCWDGELLLDFAMDGRRFVHVAENWAGFRIHEASITGSGRQNARYVKERARLFEKATGRAMSQGDRITASLLRAGDRLMRHCSSVSLIATPGRRARAASVRSNP